MKNIPVPADNREYIKRLIEKTESLIKRMRWKAFFYLHPEAKAEKKETYGFKSRKTPPQIDDMMKFEDDLLQTIENIQFRNVKSTFLSKLRNDVDNIKKSERLFVPADKTSNYYKLDKSEYTKLVKDNTTAKYKRTSESQINQINQEARNIASNIQLEDRIETIAKKQAFISIKDHKENFPNHVQCRLINPAKSEMGIISKAILDRINNDIVKATQVHQWKNTSSCNQMVQLHQQQRYMFIPNLRYSRVLSLHLSETLGRSN